MDPLAPVQMEGETHVKNRCCFEAVLSVAVSALCLASCASDKSDSERPVSVPQNILVSAETRIYEYAFDGSLLSEMEIPQSPGCCGYGRDLVMLEDGRLALYNGTFEPILSIYDRENGLWSQMSLAGWSTVNSGTAGGIASADGFIYVTDMDTLHGEAVGIVRFDPWNDRAERFLQDEEYEDVTLGLDGMLYCLRNEYGSLDVVDPSSMTVTRSAALGHTSSSRAVAADEDGYIYLASWRGTLSRYSPGGEKLQSVVVDICDYNCNLADIDMATDGSILLGTTNGVLGITDKGLSRISSLPSPGRFVAFGSIR